MPETIHNDYEVSSEGAIRHWNFPYARLEDATPTPTNPAEVMCITPGLELTGTILTIDATNSEAIIDCTCSMVYQFYVRNVLTYADAAEATWGVINVGDTVYYDSSATMPAGVYLSTSPAAADTTVNPVFGRVVLNQDDVCSDFPTSTATASTETLAIMQVGAGGS